MGRRKTGSSARAQGKAWASDHRGLIRLAETFLRAWVQDPPPRAPVGLLASVKMIEAAPAQSCRLLPSDPVRPPTPHLQPAEGRGSLRPERGRGMCACAHAHGGWGACRVRWPMGTLCERVTINDRHGPPSLFMFEPHSQVSLPGLSQLVQNPLPHRTERGVLEGREGAAHTSHAHTSAFGSWNQHRPPTPEARTLTDEPLWGKKSLFRPFQGGQPVRGLSLGPSPILGNRA